MFFWAYLIRKQLKFLVFLVYLIRKKWNSLFFELIPFGKTQIPCFVSLFNSEKLKFLVFELIQFGEIPIASFLIWFTWIHYYHNSNSSDNEKDIIFFPIQKRDEKTLFCPYVSIKLRFKNLNTDKHWIHKIVSIYKILEIDKQRTKIKSDKIVCHF